MFDTVNLWMGSSSSSIENPFEVLLYLSNVTMRQAEKGRKSASGMMGNYRVGVYQNGISLKGSLAKNYYGNNACTLQRTDVERAIEQLSDYLHLNVKDARVTRFDVSTIIQTRQPPGDYYRYLGEKKYYSRVQSTSDTLYYNNPKVQLCLYDKTKEVRSKGLELPDILHDSNLLRYEVRHHKPKREFKYSLTAKELYQREFYRSTVKDWGDKFKEIEKRKEPSFMIDNVSTPKEAENALFAHLLQKEGADTIDSYLATLKANKAFSERQRYSDLKRRLKALIAINSGEQSELIKEVENKIADIVRYSR